MSFPFQESIDVDQWTGDGANSFACVHRNPIGCPARYGHLCVAFIEIFCCPTGSVVRRLTGDQESSVEDRNGLVTDGVIHYRNWVGSKQTPGVPWDGSFYLPTTMPGHTDPLFTWLDSSGAVHSINPNVVAGVALAALPGHPLIPGDPPIPAGTYLDVTAPADYPPGCTGPFYYALSSREWIDVIQSDGVDDDGNPKFTSNCWMQCYLQPVPPR